MADHESSHPAASALLAGPLQGIGKREGNDQMREAGEWLAERAEEVQGPPRRIVLDPFSDTMQVEIYVGPRPVERPVRWRRWWQWRPWR